MTHWLEGGDFGHAVVGRDIIHGHAASLGQPKIRVLLDTLVGAVLSAEVERCGPVVATFLSTVFQWSSALANLKSSLNVQVVQVLFPTMSYSPGFISGTRLFPPTI
jgi:hypothetical protein